MIDSQDFYRLDKYPTTELQSQYLVFWYVYTFWDKRVV